MNGTIRRFLPQYVMYALRQFKNFNILANKYGQFETIKKFSCLDKDGNPTPWFTYPAIEYLSHLDFSGISVLEYGSGNSTLWWAARCSEITSIEHDVEWYHRIKKELNGKIQNVSYILERDPKKYPEQDYIEKADIVIIDGTYRSKCADFVIKKIAEPASNVSMLIFDNSDWYPNTMKKIREELGWIESDFHGFTPINGYTATTTIFINPKNYAKIKYSRNLMSLSGLAENAVNNPDD